jgi:hypothetical protein
MSAIFTWEILMKIFIVPAVAILFGLTLTLLPTAIHAAAPGAMSGGDFATRGYNSTPKQRGMAQPKAAQQRKPK